MSTAGAIIAATAMISRRRGRERYAARPVLQRLRRSRRTRETWSVGSLSHVAGIWTDLKRAWKTGCPDEPIGPRARRRWRVVGPPVRSRRVEPAPRRRSPSPHPKSPGTRGPTTSLLGLQTRCHTREAQQAPATGSTPRSSMPTVCRARRTPCQAALPTCVGGFRQDAAHCF